MTDVAIRRYARELLKALPPALRSIPGGVDLFDAIAEAFARHRGWLQGVGFVEDVELRFGSDAADVRRSYRGRFALAQLSGPLGGPYGATLSRIDAERVEVLAGVLLAARSGGVSLLLTSSGEAPVASPEAMPPVETAARAPAAAPSPPRSSFAARVGIARPIDDDDEDAQELPERGDLVEHFAFGLCEVLSVAGDRFVLRDLRGPGRIREIVADRLSIAGPSERDGKRLFQLTRKR